MEMARYYQGLSTVCVVVVADFFAFSANKIDSSLLRVLLACTAAPMLFKQYINVVQMIVASEWLAEGDIVERKERRAKKGW